MNRRQRYARCRKTAALKRTHQTWKGIRDTQSGKVTAYDQPTRSMADGLIGTTEAAEILGCSRPYVAMLIDRKRLAGAIVTADGHRRVPRSVVLKLKAEQQQTASLGNDAKNYRQAAQDAGMYKIPDEGYEE